MMHKKGQAIEGLQALVVPLIGIAIVLVVGFLIMAEAKTQVVDNIVAGSVTEELITWSNNTYVGFGAGSSLADASCTQVVNGSAGIVIGSANYTCDRSGFKLIDSTGYNWNNTLLVNYTYKQASYAFNGTGDVQNAMSDIPGWLPIIVITVIGALLLGLVAAFRSR